ncbi:MAG: thioesterase family protein, partial [Acidimicrobiia bacterium]
ALHGGAPSALLAHLLGRHDPGPASFIARLTVELLRPIPIAGLQAAVRTIRPGKKVQWLEGALLADGVEVARATALRLSPQDVDVADAVSPEVAAPLRPSTGTPPPGFAGRDLVGYWTANEIRLVEGGFGIAGPATAWLRLKCPVVADEPVRPFERVAAAADFGSGIGNPLTFVTASAINPEVTIHTFRHPVGAWVALESGAWAASHGVGLAGTSIHDERGLIGRAAQTLLVSPLDAGSRPRIRAAAVKRQRGG